MLSIQRAVRQANVVEDVVHLACRNGLSNVLFDQIAQLRGLLDTNTALAPNVKNERPIVCARKEVLPKKRYQRKGAQAEQQKDGDENNAGSTSRPSRS